jgi:hypothetical protein
MNGDLPECDAAGDGNPAAAPRSSFTQRLRMFELQIRDGRIDQASR